MGSFGSEKNTVSCGATNESHGATTQHISATEFCDNYRKEGSNNRIANTDGSWNSSTSSGNPSVSHSNSRLTHQNLMAHGNNVNGTSNNPTNNSSMLQLHLASLNVAGSAPRSYTTLEGATTLGSSGLSSSFHLRKTPTLNGEDHDLIRGGQSELGCAQNVRSEGILSDNVTNVNKNNAVVGPTPAVPNSSNVVGADRAMPTKNDEIAEHVHDVHAHTNSNTNTQTGNNSSNSGDLIPRGTCNDHALGFSHSLKTTSSLDLISGSNSTDSTAIAGCSSGSILLEQNENQVLGCDRSIIISRSTSAGGLEDPLSRRSGSGISSKDCVGSRSNTNTNTGSVSSKECVAGNNNSSRSSNVKRVDQQGDHQQDDNDDYCAAEDLQEGMKQAEASFADILHSWGERELEGFETPPEHPLQPHGRVIQGRLNMQPHSSHGLNHANNHPHSGSNGRGSALNNYGKIYKNYGIIEVQHTERPHGSNPKRSWP